MKLATVVLAMILLCSCEQLTNATHSGYHIVASRMVEVPDPTDFNGGTRQQIAFTVKHNGHIIKAHCQSWDIHNTCSLLRVGQWYDFEQDVNFLATNDKVEPKGATLGIEEDKLEGEK